MQSLAGRVQMNGVRALGGAARPASSAERLRISGAVPLPRTQFSGPSRLGWVPHAPVSCRGAGSSPQCAASSAAAAGSAALPPPPAQQQQQPAAPPALPAWAGRVARLAGAALLFAAWYSLAGVLGGPFASVGLAAAPVANEGLKTAVRSAWAGLAAGCLHTLAGADHLAALTPLTIGRSQFKASLLGALWGLGHSTGQLILGLLMVLLKDRFTQLVPALTKWGGATVGATLLAIGAMGLYETFFEQHEEHDERDPAAEAFTGMEMQGGVLVAKKERGGFGLATFATGIVYGLQPDALFVIVPALALPTKLAASAYIVMFVLGTVAAMGAYTGVIGATSAAIKKSNSGLTQKLSGFASFAALALGATMLLGGLGVELPFSLPFGLGHDH
ncbi:nickel transporter [Micractinium conductrix]|uniref:Nickel transporter n=1 Tax=Micractinium conductrix TaxID=554055 RepID=A0A2P6V541_9CHLO|nr:nickel transporter [Micractinium conductrix]|eukprot:PSC69194.1 nickel transporter [Micractinium conductrix]